MSSMSMIFNHIKHLPTYLRIYLPPSLPTYLPPYLPTYLPIYLWIYLFIDLSSELECLLTQTLQCFLPTQNIIYNIVVMKMQQGLSHLQKPCKCYWSSVVKRGKKTHVMCKDDCLSTDLDNVVTRYCQEQVETGIYLLITDGHWGHGKGIQ
jgi:hypothetical protein